MTDIWPTEKRSEVMSHIRSHGNKSTEQRLIDIFRDSKIKGWRRRQKIFGNPDFVFRAQRLCVFVDGCFWHGCPEMLPTSINKPSLLGRQGSTQQGQGQRGES